MLILCLIIVWNLLIFLRLEPGVWQDIGFFYGNGFILFRWIYPALIKFKEKQKADLFVPTFVRKRKEQELEVLKEEREREAFIERKRHAI